MLTSSQWVTKNIDAVFYMTYPLLYYKFENMVIFGQETYIRFVAQETSMIIKLFIFLIFSVEIGDQSFIIKNILVYKLIPIKIQLLFCRFRPFWLKNKKNESWATKWILVSWPNKCDILNLWYNSGSVLKTASMMCCVLANRTEFDDQIKNLIFNQIKSRIDSEMNSVKYGYKTFTSPAEKGNYFLLFDTRI